MKSTHVGQKWILVNREGLMPDSRSIVAKLTREMKHTYVYDERDSRESKAAFWGALFHCEFLAIDLP